MSLVSRASRESSPTTHPLAVAAFKASLNSELIRYAVPGLLRFRHVSSRNLNRDQAPGTWAGGVDAVVEAETVAVAVGGGDGVAEPVPMSLSDSGPSFSEPTAEAVLEAGAVSLSLSLPQAVAASPRVMSINVAMVLWLMLPRFSPNCGQIKN